MTKHSRITRPKPVGTKHTHSHHKTATNRTVRRAHIRTGWALLIISCWVVIGLITGLTLLHSARDSSRQSVTVKALNTAYDSTGHDPFVPGTGNTFVLIDVEIANTTLETFNLAPVVQSYLTDAKGARYDMSPAVLDRPIAAGRLASGVRTRGTLSYIVPRGVTRLTFHFDADSPQQVRYKYELPVETHP